MYLFLKRIVLCENLLHLRAIASGAIYKVVHRKLQSPWQSVIMRRQVQCVFPVVISLDCIQWQQKYAALLTPDM